MKKSGHTNWRNVFLIFRREVLDQLRDRRTLFMVAVLPVLLYPMLGIGMAQMTAIFAEQPRTVVILGASELPPPPLVKGHRFAPEWFRSPAHAEKLNVITDMPQSFSGADETPKSAADDTLLHQAGQLRDSINEKRRLERELAADRSKDATTNTGALEKTLRELNQEISTTFARSPIDVLVLIPPEFANVVAQRQEALMDRADGPSEVSDPIPRPILVKNSADDKSLIAHQRVREVISAWEQSILKEQLRKSELPANLASPINALDLDLAEREHVSANVWAKLFPALLIIMSLTGAFYPAIDLCAGEKERGTMETLLISPASRTEIVLGKFLTILLFSMTTAVLNLLSIGMTGKYMASLALGGASSRMGDLTLPPLVSLAWVVVILIPLATLFSAVCLAMATFARSSKEGQYYLTPLLMIALGLMMFAISPGNEIQPFYSVIPVIGPGLLLKSLLKANGPDAETYLYAIPVLANSIGFSFLALWWAVEQFGSEEVLFRESEQFDLRSWVRHLIRDKRPLPTFGASFFCFLLIMLLQFGTWKPFQTILQNTSPADRGRVQILLLILQQVMTIAAPALVMATVLTSSLTETMSMRWPGLLKLTCAALAPIALHPLVLELMAAVQWFFPPLPPGVAELMMELKSAPWWLAIFAIAVTPAFCEEIAFRGFLLSGFRQKGKIAPAVLLSSFTFGIIHMIPQQVFNAMLLGLLLGTICVRTGSLLPCIVFHFVHNSLVVLHDQIGNKIPTTGLGHYFFRFDEGSLRYQPALLVMAFAVGVLLLWPLLRRTSDAKLHEIQSSKGPYETAMPVNNSIH